MRSRSRCLQKQENDRSPIINFFWNILRFLIICNWYLKKIIFKLLLMQQTQNWCLYFDFVSWNIGRFVCSTRICFQNFLHKYKGSFNFSKKKWGKWLVGLTVGVESNNSLVFGYQHLWFSCSSEIGQLWGEVWGAGPWFKHWGRGWGPSAPSFPTLQFAFSRCC